MVKSWPIILNSYKEQYLVHTQYYGKGSGLHDEGPMGLGLHLIVM